MQQEIWFQKYRIIRLLGRGGTAKVYLAEHIKLNSYRAIKCISKNNPLYELQLKEAQILKNLKHSCIPTIYDIEEDEDGSYIVEQYLEGETLKEYVLTRGSLDFETIIQFALQLCDLIHYLHYIERPILYLDLKPENILVTDQRIRLVDFGSAIYRDESERGEQDYYGTDGFAAPEMYSRSGIDERCDIYGIGILLYYMATGKLPPAKSKDAPWMDALNDCPKKLKKIINRCLRYHPSQRYASVKQLSRQLSAGGAKLPVLCESGPSIRIAVAGAQPRIGVTHFAFRLCRFILQKHIRCLYLARNENQLLRAIRSRYVYPDMDGEIFKNHGIPMLERGYNRTEVISDYRVVVEDLGCLNSDNLPYFLEAEVPLLIMGSKDWELAYAERVLELVKEHKDILYLFNYLESRQFREASKLMDHRNCYRIPYVPDLYGKAVRGAELEFFEELMHFIPERINA